MNDNTNRQAAADCVAVENTDLTTGLILDLARTGKLTMDQAASILSGLANGHSDLSDRPEGGKREISLHRKIAQRFNTALAQLESNATETAGLAGLWRLRAFH